MNKGWVFDSSPLIILGKIGRLDLIEDLPGTLYVPLAVKKEILAPKNHDPASRWLLAKNCPARVVRPPLSEEVQAWDLGAGETEAISHALGNREWVVVLDDMRARRCATAMGARVKGTIGLLLWLKKQEKLDELKPVLDTLSKSGFHLDPTLLGWALKLADEADGSIDDSMGPAVQEPRAVYKIGRSQTKKRKTKPKTK